MSVPLGSAHMLQAPLAPDCSDRLQRAAGFLGLLLIPAIGIHAWPMQELLGSRLLWPANIVLIIWTVCAIAACRRRASRLKFYELSPPACVWALLIVCALSVSAAEQLPRTVTSAGKIVFCMLATYTLVKAACRGRNTAGQLLWWLAATVSVVIVHASVQAFSGHLPVALFESKFKLGSFLAMGVPCAAIYLARQPGRAGPVWATLLVIVSLCLVQSAWAWVGIVAGTTLGALSAVSLRKWLLTTILAAVIAVNAAQLWGATTGPSDDMQLLERDGQHARQRYLEWQAFINLLKDRSALGTGTGCLNHHRSEYYQRLPKNNTIEPFDQNGYLAVAAELGLPGFFALCWVLGACLARGWARRGYPLITPAWAGIVGVSVAQIGSSMFYNGILVMAVALMAIIGHESRDSVSDE